MHTYDLTAEYLALIVAIIALVSLSYDNEPGSTRYRMFRLMYYGCVVSIVFTISSTLVSEYREIFPLWLEELLKVIYYICAPIVSAICFFYALSFRQFRSSKITITGKAYLVLLPYILYVMLILSNYIFHSVFTIDPVAGYTRGPLYQSTYVIAGVYILGVVIIAIRNRRTSSREILIILCINMLVSAIISSFQLIFSHVLLSGFASVSGALIIHLYIQNVTQRKDELTTLYNRKTLTYHMHNLAAKKEPFSLFVFSLRNFKGVNERLGLAVGDALLEAISLHFKNNFPAKNLYRYGGDEFAVLIPNITSQMQYAISETALRFDKPFFIDSKEVAISISYTRVDFPSFGQDIKTLFSTTDYSLSLLKETSSERRFLYDIHVRDEMQRKTHIIERMIRAIENDGFDVYYQPIYSDQNRYFPQAEALIRLRDAHMDNLFPSEFIPVAEKTGLINRITYIVLEKVCQDLHRYRLRGENSHMLKSISINFPYSMFLQKDMPDKVSAMLEKYDVRSSEIKIEITERTLVSDAKTIQDVMSVMLNRGFIFELDDFGVEYSNMSVFLNLPIGIIKIDRSLVLATTTTAENRVFFEHLICGIRAIGREVIVEGVEEKQLLSYVVGCGCAYVQGYVFSRPLPYEEFEAFLEEHNVNRE